MRICLRNAQILGRAGFESDTVADEYLSGSDDQEVFRQCQKDQRTLVTLDLDFSNVRAYPPGSHHGIIVLRPSNQSKPSLLTLLRQVLAVLAKTSPETQLWIVTKDRIRVRKG